MTYVIILAEGMLTLDAAHTDNEVDLGAEIEGEILMTHEVVHIDSFNDTHLRNTLFDKSMIRMNHNDSRMLTHALTSMPTENSFADGIFVLLLKALLFVSIRSYLLDIVLIFVDVCCLAGFLLSLCAATATRLRGIIDLDIAVTLDSGSFLSLRAAFLGITVRCSTPFYRHCDERDCGYAQRQERDATWTRQ